ncbi:MAG: MFS transporter [Chloroflexota bacterium]|nr:MFS transporter [Chloroflexota bacterium]
MLARQVGGSDSVAGLPQAALVAGAALSALILSRLTLHRGRYAALSTGAAVAVAGCVVVAVAVLFASLPLILLGCLLLGAGNTAVMLGRYAAADLGPEASRGARMASVLVATTIGAVVGPNLLAPASGLAVGLGLPALAGPYLVAAIGFTAAAATLTVAPRLRPMPSSTAELGGPTAASVAGTAVAATVLGRQGFTGLGVLSLANLVMVAVMTMAPVQLHHIGSGLGMIGLVVSLHIAAMFAPSPVSGWLTDRVGAPRTAAGAGATLIAASWLAAGAESPASLTVAMVLLGCGWNLALLSGSTLLTAGVPSAQRPRREGWGEVGMGAAAAGGGAASGPLMAVGGYGLLTSGAAVIAALVLPLAWHAAATRSNR